MGGVGNGTEVRIITPDNGYARVIVTPDNGYARVIITPDNGYARAIATNACSRAHFLISLVCHVYVPPNVRLKNPLTPNDPYRGCTTPLTSKFAFYIFIQQI